LEPIEGLLETQVREIIEIAFIAARVRLVATLHSLNALPKEALSTAGHLHGKALEGLYEYLYH
jgi:hypothetical protein